MTIEVAPKVLRGRHVVLEPLCASHVDGLFEIGKEQDDWAYLPIPGFHRRDDASQWVEQALQLGEQGQHVTFVLLQPDSGAVMGSTRYLNIRARDHGLEIGYTWLARAYQRTPVNTEAKYLLLTNAFESIGAYRVELKTDLRNLRGQTAIERLGAHKEGVLRRHMIVQNDYVRDSVCYSIIDSDWPAIRARLEAKLADKALAD